MRMLVVGGAQWVEDEWGRGRVGRGPFDDDCSLRAARASGPEVPIAVTDQVQPEACNLKPNSRFESVSDRSETELEPRNLKPETPNSELITTFAPVKNIAIFASGNGSNAQRIIDHFRNSPQARVTLMVCNNPNAYALERAKQSGIPALVIDRSTFVSTDEVVSKLKEANIDLIVLAGFLWLIPLNLIHAFPDRIINIHPALLPAFGGKGMYGMNVHKAVRDAGVKETGITIHYVNEHYDSGEIIMQERCAIDENDTPETISAKVRELEHKYFPVAVENVVNGLK